MSRPGPGTASEPAAAAPRSSALFIVIANSLFIVFHAYVTNATTNTVSVIDTTSDTVTATIGAVCAMRRLGLLSVTGSLPESRPAEFTVAGRPYGTAQDRARHMLRPRRSALSVV